jgi:hypothetical protein
VKHGQRVRISGFLLIFLIAGCAATYTYLKEEDVRDIRKLAIITILEDENLRILDRTGIKQQSYFSPYFGWAGIAADALLTESVASANIRGSLGGDPDLLRYEISDISIKELFDETFYKAFTIGCETISRETVDSLQREYQAEAKKAGSKEAADPIAGFKELGVNVILTIKFIYGLAVFGGGVSPSTVICAEVSFANIEKEKVLRKRISSDSFYKKGYTVDEFTANGAGIFKKELAEATWALAYLVASEFGVELSRKNKSYWRTDQ